MAFQNPSLKRKLVGTMFETSLLVLLLTCVLLFYYEIRNYRQASARNLSTMADIIAANSSAILIFDDQNLAQQILSGLRVEPDITAAAFFDENGKLFAKYPAARPVSAFPISPEPDGIETQAAQLTLFKPVMQGQKRVGTLFLQENLNLTGHLKVYSLVLFMVLAASGMVALFLSNFFQRQITEPLLNLANVAKAVSGRKDYSMRATKTSADEVGDLTEAFNSMLDQIQASHAALTGSEERFVRFMRHLPGLAWIKSRDGRYVYANDAAQSIFGKNAEQLYGKTDQDIFPPETAEQFQKNDVRALASEAGVQDVEMLRHADGEVHYSLVSKFPIRGAGGEATHIAGMAIDITERRRAEEASHRLAAIVESSDDAIISKDLNGIITSWNEGAERIFGYTAAETIGRPITILIPPEYQHEEIDILSRIRNGLSVNHFETVRRCKDGSLLEMSLTISPIRSADGKILGASKIGRDITARKQTERELKRLHEEALAASRAKDDFLAALSHELRTPLNPVLLVASDAANDLKLPAAMRADFEMIRRNVELEARLIDDLLDLTRIERGKLLLDWHLLDAHVVLQEAIATVRMDMEKKQIKLLAAVHAGDHVVHGDTVRLQQVFWNVLKNAVKFTPEGGKINVETAAKDGRLTVKITDTGIGMDAEELKRIFVAFSQGDHARDDAHRFGGLGLGLTISRVLVELHAGTIRASSEGKGKGATFLIDLPLAQISKKEAAMYSAKHPAQTSPAQSPGTGAPLRILLVEDHEPTREALTHLLARRRYEVTAAAAASEARAAAAKQNFDVLISDIGLPDGNGYDLMEEFRDRYGLKGIALTGYGTEQNIARGQKCGFEAYLIKPVRMESLVNALAAVLGGEPDPES